MERRCARSHVLRAQVPHTGGGRKLPLVPQPRAPGPVREGRIVRWAGSLTDIDDLIRAEERARENELRFRTMISAVPSLTFESDGTVTTPSPATSGSAIQV